VQLSRSILASALPFSLLLASAAPAGAQSAPGPRAITLEEAIKLAVHGNPALAATGADIAIAAAAAESARGPDDFVIDASANWLETRSKVVEGTPVQQPAYDELSASLSLRKPLPTGGSLGLRLLGDFNRTRFATELGASAGPARPPVDFYAPSLQLTFAHPLLRGRGVNVARADRRRARVRGDIASAQRDAAAAGLVRDVVSVYWDLAYATQELEIRRGAAASAREQLRRVEANVQVGKQPRSASAEVDVAIALRDEAVLLYE
jgi:outer membrane protein TolC